MGKIAVELDDQEMERLLAAANAAPAVDQHSLPADATRAKRLAAIMSVHGIWKDDPTKPKDPVAYQREMRAEPYDIVNGAVVNVRPAPLA